MEGVGVSLVVVGSRVVEGEGVLLVRFYCVGGMLLVEVGCGCGWKALRRVLSRVSLVMLDRKCRGGWGGCCVGCRWWCSIADLGGRCFAGRWLGVFLVGCELGCC